MDAQKLMFLVYLIHLVINRVLKLVAKETSWVRFRNTKRIHRLCSTFSDPDIVVCIGYGNRANSFDRGTQSDEKVVLFSGNIVRHDNMAFVASKETEGGERDSC